VVIIGQQYNNIYLLLYYWFESVINIKLNIREVFRLWDYNNLNWFRNLSKNWMDIQFVLKINFIVIINLKHFFFFLNEGF